MQIEEFAAGEILVANIPKYRKGFVMPPTFADRGARLIKLRFRQGDFACAFIRDGNAISQFAVVDLGDAFSFSENHELARNAR